MLHDTGCPVFRGADPDAPGCRCDEPGGTRRPAAVPPQRDRPATPEQVRRLNVLATKAGIRDRAEKLAFVYAVTRRRVTSSNHLSQNENRAVCARLQAKIDGEPTC